MKTHIICERDVGLFSLIQQVIAQIHWAEHAQRIPIVLFGERCCYWSPGGYRSRDTVWEYYFEPLHPDYPTDSLSQDVRSKLSDSFPRPDEPGFWLKSDVWVSSNFGDHPGLRNRSLVIPYGWRDPGIRLRARAARILQEYVRPRTYIKGEVDTFHARNMGGRPFIGVQIRGTDAVSQHEDRAHRKDSLSLEIYQAEIQGQLELNPDAGIFVATDDERSLNFIRETFGERVVACDSCRHVSGDVAGRGPTGWLMPAYIAGDRALAARNGEEAVVEFLLLSRCDVLLHNGSSLARTVLLTKPDMPHVNTNRKNRLLAYLQTASIKKIRRCLKQAVRRAPYLARMAPPDE